MENKKKYIFFIIYIYIIYQPSYALELTALSLSSEIIHVSNEDINYMIPIIDNEHCIYVIFFDKNNNIIYPVNLSANDSRHINNVTLNLLTINNKCNISQCILYNDVLINFNSLLYDIYYINTVTNKHESLSITQNITNPYNYITDMFEIKFNNKEFIFRNYTKIIHILEIEDIKNIIKRANINRIYVIHINKSYINLNMVTFSKNNNINKYHDYINMAYRSVIPGPVSYLGKAYNNTIINIMKNNSREMDIIMKEIKKLLYPTNITYIQLSRPIIINTIKPSYHGDYPIKNSTVSYITNYNNLEDSYEYIDYNEPDEPNEYDDPIELSEPNEHDVPIELSEPNEPNEYDDPDEPNEYGDTDDTQVINYIHYTLNNGQFNIFIITIIILSMIYYSIKIMFYCINNVYNEEYKSNYYNKITNNSKTNNPSIQSHPLPNIPSNNFIDNNSVQNELIQNESIINIDCKKKDIKYISMNNINNIPCAIVNHEYMNII